MNNIIDWELIESYLYHLKETILHLLLPNTCMFCGEVIEYYQMHCESCEKIEKLLNNSKCLECHKEQCICRESHYFSRVIAAFDYLLGAKRAVCDLKFNNNCLNALKLGKFMAIVMYKFDRYKEIDYIMPVPLHKKDLKERGFNQSNLLAKCVSKHIGIPYLCDVLVKVKHTKKQHDITPEERKINLIAAFGVYNSDAIKGKIILLVDDVFTTGATMDCCAKTLLEAGAKEVFCLVAAKVCGNKVEVQKGK